MIRCRSSSCSRSASPEPGEALDPRASGIGRRKVGIERRSARAVDVPHRDVDRRGSTRVRFPPPPLIASGSSTFGRLPFALQWTGFAGRFQVRLRHAAAGSAVLALENSPWSLVMLEQARTWLASTAQRSPSLRVASPPRQWSRIPVRCRLGMGDGSIPAASTTRSPEHRGFSLTECRGCTGSCTGDGWKVAAFGRSWTWTSLNSDDTVD